MRIGVLGACLIVGALAACSTAPSPSASGSPPTATPVAMAWTREAIDANPGGVVVSGIAAALDVPANTVQAAVFGFTHREGNAAEIWVFRAEGLSSLTVAGRVAGAQGTSRCPGAAQSTSLEGLPTIVVRYAVVDQCQPEYLVALDEQTVAKIIDDGAYHGTQNPTVPYRPAVDIAQLVVWLQQNLPGIPLMTGGPIPQN